jgi:hypothetical protein
MICSLLMFGCVFLVLQIFPALALEHLCSVSIRPLTLHLFLPSFCFKTASYPFQATRCLFPAVPIYETDANTMKETSIATCNIFISYAGGLDPVTTRFDTWTTRDYLQTSSLSSSEPQLQLGQKRKETEGKESTYEPTASDIEYDASITFDENGCPILTENVFYCCECGGADENGRCKGVSITCPNTSSHGRSSQIQNKRYLVLIQSCIHSRMNLPPSIKAAHVHLILSIHLGELVVVRRWGIRVLPCHVRKLGAHLVIDRRTCSHSHDRTARSQK